MPHPPRILRYLWASPNTLLIGVPLAAGALVTGGGARVHEGVLEIYGGLPAFLILRCIAGIFLRGGASAITFGHSVLARTPQLLHATRQHERVHVRQYERWGLLFIPAYLIACVIAMLRGKRAYMDNVFEREAYRHQA